MATKISNCGINENGKTTGGKAGDQTGKEYAVISWYSRPWKCILRFPDPKVGEEIARISEAAAKNNNVGYCQTHRRTYHDALKAANWNPAAIKTPVEADCSASTIANIIAAGHKCGITALKQINPDGYTGNMRAALKKAGFTVLTDSKYLSSSDYLLPGDILLNDGVHTAVNLTAGVKAKAKAVTAPATAPTAASAEKTIWNFLTRKGLNAYAVAGIMGNLYAESALNPMNLQNSYEKKIGLSDHEYTVAVDTGAYTNFVKDCAGYGLAQWTYYTRKQGLLNKAKAAGKSIGDLNIQLSFIWDELQGYTKVLQQLKAAGSVAEAASAFMLGYERPADQGAAAQKKRASYSQKYFDKYAGSSATPTPAGKNEPDAAYKVGRNYTLQANMYVRKAANGEKLPFSSLTVDGKAHGYADGAGKAILKKGTVVTCKGLEKAAGGAIWVKIPSGYVCGISGSGKIYIK